MMAVIPFTRQRFSIPTVRPSGTGEVLRAPTGAERVRIKPISPVETIRRQQEAVEVIGGIGRVRIPFFKERVFAVPSPDPLKVVITEIAARTPELVVNLPMAAVNFFRKNINTIVAGKPVKTEQFKTILGFDPKRFNISDEVLTDTTTALFKQADIEEQKNPSRGDSKIALENAIKATAKTVLPDVIDVLFGFDISRGLIKAGIPAARVAVRQLPDELLYKIQISEIPTNEVIGSLTGSNPTARATQFIQGLSNEERKQLFGLSRQYEALGREAVAVAEREPTALGRFARVPFSRTPIEARPARALPGLVSEEGLDFRFAPGLKIERVRRVGGEPEIPREATFPIDKISGGERGGFGGVIENYKARIKVGEKLKPIILGEPENGIYPIVDGEHRFQAYKELGFKEIPVVFKGKKKEVAVAPEFVPEAELRSRIEILQETLDEIPAWKLWKFANKSTKELPEMTGEKARGAFRKLGDTKLSELYGFDVSEERVLRDFEDAKKIMADIKNLQEELAVTKLKAIEKKQFIREVPPEKVEVEELFGEAPKIVAPAIARAPVEIPVSAPVVFTIEKRATNLQHHLEALGGLQSPDIVRDLNEIAGYNFKDIQGLKDALATSAKTTGVSRAKMSPEMREIYKQIGAQRQEKELPGSVQHRLKQVHGIEEWKKATIEQLQGVLNDLKQLQKGDSFLTDKQLTGLKYYLEEGKFGKDSRVVTKREIVEKFKDNREIMDGVLTKWIANTGFPSVDIKQGHPVIRRIVDNADIELRAADRTAKENIQKLNELMDSAEGSRPQGVLKRDTGKVIFQRMGGDTAIELTAKELEVVNFLKSEFNRFREALGLQRYRKNYITHIEQGFFEKVLDQGVIPAIQSYMKPNTVDIPTDIMLALDNIIGSEKFFRFALQRKGGLVPTTNIRRIYRDYSTLAETKLALDKFLPEAQAAQQLLLRGKSALWLKQFLQNLKGRALDFKFRSGKMGWVARTADKVVDIGYLRLLALNIKSAAKNIIGGEVNSFVYQTIDRYLIGKQRIILHPKRAHKIISELGLLDGSYVDVARQKIISKGKKVTDVLLYGLMQASEYEIRGSFLLGQMTAEEWTSGTLTPQRFREILDGIAITQGIYTKVDSPLFVQTVMGRAVLQFGRWKITNALLVRRITTAAKAEIKAGNYKGENTRKILKMLIASGAVMYLAYELGKQGYEQGEKVAKAGAELVLTIVSFMTGETIYEALAKNPTLQTFGDIVYTLQELASYITFGIVDEPRQLQFQRGIDEVYVSALQTLGLQGKEEPSVGGIDFGFGEKAGIRGIAPIDFGFQRLRMPSIR